MNQEICTHCSPSSSSDAFPCLLSSHTTTQTQELHSQEENSHVQPQSQEEHSPIQPQSHPAPCSALHGGQSGAVHGAGPVPHPQGSGWGQSPPAQLSAMGTDTALPQLPDVGFSAMRPLASGALLSPAHSRPHVQLHIQLHNVFHTVFHASFGNKIN